MHPAVRLVCLLQGLTYCHLLQTAATTTGDQLEQTDQEQETSSNENNTSSLRLDKAKPEPMSEEAKKRRRQEINRESARRVRKRKSMEHATLQQQVGP